MGGYIAASTALCDYVRSFSSGFIFTTALPPSLAAGACAAVSHLKESSHERERQQDRVRRVREGLDQRRIPHLENPSHIVPVMVCDPVQCKLISDLLMDEFGVYIQPINYPTVPRGLERLRITPSPLHSDEDIDHLLNALDAIWTRVGAMRSAGLEDMSGLTQLCPVAGPMKMDPVELGVANCPWVGERDDADLSGVSKAGA
jgi:5-aminolevulinate synthase